jgi:hypothetical protein
VKYNKMAREILSLRELEKAMIDIPLPFPASLIAAFGLTYSETGNSIWTGSNRRVHSSRRNYSPNTSNVTSPRYSRRINQGARD